VGRYTLELLLAYGETPLAESATIDYSAAVRVRREHYLLFFRMQYRFLYTA